MDSVGSTDYFCMKYVPSKLYKCSKKLVSIDNILPPSYWWGTRDFPNKANGKIENITTWNSDHLSLTISTDDSTEV